MATASTQIRGDNMVTVTMQTRWYNMAIVTTQTRWYNIAIVTMQIRNRAFGFLLKLQIQPTFTCSKVTIETQNKV